MGFFSRTAMMTFCFSCLSFLLGFSQTPVSGAAHFPEDFPALHPRYRQWPSPAGDEVIMGRPPVLLWPSDLNKKTTYDIRLSQDPGFAAGEVIHSEGIPWTIYNPHRVLPAGRWYWQYRVHNGNWKAVSSFRIDSGTSKSASPPAGQFIAAIPETYPRVLITREAEVSFREAAKSTTDAAILIEKARASLKIPFPEDESLAHQLKVPVNRKNYQKSKVRDNDSKHIGFQVMGTVKSLCQAYLLTGDTVYSARGKAWAMTIAQWDPDGPTGISDFGNAGCMVAMALAFDSFNDQLSFAEKEKLVSQVKIRAGRLYHEWVNDLDAKVLSNHVWQFLLHYFFQTALAMHGQLKEANQWLTYAYELWLGRAPVLGGTEGGWLEGASYFRINMETLLDIPMIIKDYTGYDAINSNTWYERNAYWMFYSFPPASFSDGFGDNVETISAPDGYYLSYADALSRLTGSRMAATYAGRIEAIEKIHMSDVVPHEPPETANMFRWFRLRYLMKTTRPEVLPDSVLASSLVLHDIGVVDLHSDINHGDKDLMVSMRSSPYGAYGHMLADQNTFNVLYGGKRLFYMSGYKVAMKDPHRLGWYKATIGHNGILIDGKGQTFDPEGYGWIPRFMSGKAFTYAVGDASMAYGGRSGKNATGLTTFRRHVLFLPPDLLVVYDVLSADHPAEWSWLIHSPEKILMDTTKNDFYCAVDSAAAFTTLYTSNPVQWKLSDRFGVPAVNWMGKRDEDGNLVPYKDNQWHLSLSTRQKTPQMRFLSVMKIGTGKNKFQKHSSILIRAGKELVIGDWKIDAELDTSQPPLLKASSKDGKHVFSSGGNSMNAGGVIFKGTIPGSAKMAEFINGQWHFQEKGDQIPEAVKEIPVKINK